MEQKGSNELWQGRIAAYKESPLSLINWCNANNVSFSAMKYHMYKKPKIKVPKSETVTFIPATIIDEVVGNPQALPIKLCIGTATVFVDNSTDLSLLKKVIEALS